MTDESVYDELDVPTVINAAGTKTRISGTLMRTEAADAMRAAAGSFVRISDLQARASERIAESTGAEAGYVTSGAAAGLTLATAACIAGDDLGTMSRLPDVEETASEVVMARSHRTDYDHAIRAAGASIVDVGTNDRALGAGSVSVEPWEFEDAISEETAAVAYVATSASEPPLPDVVDIAHTRGVPVIVDAAAELPPRSNLRKFVEQGADLVAFSGGKAIRGPQSTGMLAGRQDLIRSVALQHLDMDAVFSVWEPPRSLVDPDTLPGVPKHGIGRGMKVGKEEIVGFLAALESFLDGDDSTDFDEWDRLAREMARRLESTSKLRVRLEDGGEESVTTVEIAVVEGVDAAALVRSLAENPPRVYVNEAGVEEGRFGINPMCLSNDEADVVVDRIVEFVEEQR